MGRGVKAGEVVPRIILNSRSSFHRPLQLPPMDVMPRARCSSCPLNSTSPQVTGCIYRGGTLSCRYSIHRALARRRGVGSGSRWPAGGHGRVSNTKKEVRLRCPYICEYPRTKRQATKGCASMQDGWRDGYGLEPGTAHPRARRPHTRLHARAHTHTHTSLPVPAHAAAAAEAARWPMSGRVSARPVHQPEPPLLGLSLALSNRGVGDLRCAPAGPAQDPCPPLFLGPRPPSRRAPQPSSHAHVMPCFPVKPVITTTTTTITTNICTM